MRTRTLLFDHPGQQLQSEKALSLLHITVLALVQGITEFLPISSSAHLILVPVVTGWPDQGLIIDVAVHVGTLGAVIVYFWLDVLAMMAGLGDLVRGRFGPNARLVTFVAVGTIPVLAAGFLVDHFYPQGIRNLQIIAWANLVFAALLYAADRLAAMRRRLEHIRLSDAAIIGLSQAIALLPGTSRSGITMTSARILGFDRTEAARFSLLLSMPTILGAGVIEGLNLYKMGSAALTYDAAVAAGLAFVSALITIWAMMRWLKYFSFMPFVLYRIVLGVLLLALAHGVIR